MPTLRLTVDPAHMDAPGAWLALEQAASILQRGGTVALPTETVYGLGANALDESAVAAIFAAKQRPSWDPLIVHVADEAMLMRVVATVPESARKLMRAYWPGPMTLLLPRSAAVPDAVTAGRPMVAVRMPAHPVALELIRMAGLPIAAPSANRFGHTSPTTAEHVLADLDGRIDAVVDSGAAAFGVESTVLDPSLSPMVIYRPGAITLEAIEAVAGPAEFYATRMALPQDSVEALPGEASSSPGLGLRHYAPRARLILVDGNAGGQRSDLVSRLYMEALLYSVGKVGVMLPTGMPGEQSIAKTRELFGSFATIYWWGPWSDAGQLAHGLFAGLRQLDAAGCSTILCPLPVGDGLATAIRDRLRKAAWPA